MSKLDRYKAKLGIATLTHILDEIGEDGLLSLIVDKLSEGTKPSDVARDLHIPFVCLWDWLSASEKRRKMYNHAWEMYANDLHAETVRIADEATVEDVAVARLRVDTRFKAAGNYDRKRFGAKDTPDIRGFAGGVTIVIGEVKSPYAVESPYAVQDAERVVDVVDAPVAAMDVQTVDALPVVDTPVLQATTLQAAVLQQQQQQQQPQQQPAFPEIVEGVVAEVVVARPVLLEAEDV